MQAVEIADVSDQEFEDLRTYQFLAICGKPGADRLARARAALEQKSHEAALTLALSAVKVDEGERARIAGKALAHLGRLEEAEAQLRAAHARSGGAHGSAEDLGILLLGMGRHDEAEPYLRHAMQSPERGERARGAYGLLLVARGDQAAALPCLRAAMEASFDHHALAAHFAACALATGQAGEAEPLLRSFADFFPGNVDLLCAHAEVLLALGQPGAARERLELPRMIAPDDARLAALWARTEDGDAPGA
jgi:tetratricopeptide (TPR) repeat protein